MIVFKKHFYIDIYVCKTGIPLVVYVSMYGMVYIFEKKINFIFRFVRYVRFSE